MLSGAPRHCIANRFAEPQQKPPAFVHGTLECTEHTNINLFEFSATTSSRCRRVTVIVIVAVVAVIVAFLNECSARCVPNHCRMQHPTYVAELCCKYPDDRDTLLHKISHSSQSVSVSRFLHTFLLLTIHKPTNQQHIMSNIQLAHNIM